MHVFGNIVEALQHGEVAGLSAAREVAITSLAYPTPRAHPPRDRHRGHSQPGLEPFLGG
jgi:hypothetical protein